MIQKSGRRLVGKSFLWIIVLLCIYNGIVFVIFARNDLRQLVQPLKYGTMELDDLAGCYTNDCTIDETGNVLVREEDPFIVLNNLVEDINYIEIIYDEEQTRCSILKLYFDAGDGFNEENTVEVYMDAAGRKGVWIPVKSHVQSIRLDFENCSEEVCFKIRKIVINPNVSHKLAELFLWIFLMGTAVSVIFLTMYVRQENAGFNWLMKLIFLAIMHAVFGVMYYGNYVWWMKLIAAGLQILLSIVVTFADRKGENEKCLGYIFLGAVFLLYFMWALIIPYGEGPDEPMRYQITDFIYRYGYLPQGGDPRIREAAYGISYAFTPILSYMISVFPVKIISLFTEDFKALLLSARIVSVLFSVGTVGFTIKIGKKVFRREYLWLFVAALAFLPQFAFISGYVNCDAIAIFAVAWIIYALLLGSGRKWDMKSCIFLGAGIGICLLSYYNTYGIILIAVFFCIYTVIADAELKENKWIFLLKRTLWVMIPAFLLAGWWFIRNYIIYDGDVLGLSTSNLYAETYAIDILKPSNRLTPNNQGLSLWYMLFDMEWLKISMYSFFAIFGMMSVRVKTVYYWCYWGLILLGTGGNLIRRKKIGAYKKKKMERAFSICMLLMCMITIAISIWYSYFNDFQAQGRYCFPMLLSLTYLAVRGGERILDRVSDRLRSGISGLLAFLMPVVSLYILFSVVLPLYV